MISLKFTDWQSKRINYLTNIYNIKLFFSINPGLVVFLVFAFIFWFHRFCKVIWRFFKFWEIRSFYSEVLNIPSVSGQYCNRQWTQYEVMVLSIFCSLNYVIMTGVMYFNDWKQHKMIIRWILENKNSLN